MLSGLLGGILWALDTVILSIALEPFGLLLAAPAAATFIHDSISALLLLAVNAVQSRKPGVLSSWKNLLKKRQVWWLAAAGVLGGPLGMSGYVFSIRFLGPGLSAVFSCLYPAVGAFMSMIFFHERFHLRQWLGLMAALAGVVCLSWGGMEEISSSSMAAGLAFAAVCVLAWGLEGVFVQYASQNNDVSSLQALTVRQCTSSLVFGMLIMPLLQSYPIVDAMLHSSSIGWIVLAAFAGTASYLFYYHAIRKIGAARAMPLNITYAAWALLFSFILLGTAPSLQQILCAVVVVGGALLCAKTPAQ